MKATKTSPMRNMVTPIRAISPRSVAYRVRAIAAPPFPVRAACGGPVRPLKRTGRVAPCGPPAGQTWLAYLNQRRAGRTRSRTGRPSGTCQPTLSGPSAGDEPVVRQQLADILDGGVLVRQDQVGRLQRGVVERLAELADPAQQSAERGPEGLFVAGVDGRLDLGVQRVQLVRGGRVNSQLALPQDAHDHAPSPACGCSAGCAPAGAAPSWPAEPSSCL